MEKASLKTKISVIRKKRSFTLLEQLLVISLIAIIGSLFAFNVQRAIQNQRYSADVHALSSYLNLAEKRMLLLGEDLEVVIDKKGAGYTVSMQRTTPPPKEGTKAALPHTFELANIKEIVFESEDRSGSWPIKIAFASFGSHMSKGTLLLKSTDSSVAGSEDRALCLMGYPSDIQERLLKDKPSCLEFEKEKRYSAIRDTYAIIANQI